MKEDRPLYNIEEDDQTEDSNSLYKINDDDDSCDDREEMITEDDLPYAFGHNPEGEDDVVIDDSSQGKSKVSKNPWGLLFKVMFSPATGWRDLKKSKITAEVMGSVCFYPLCAIAAASQFIRMIYEANLTIEGVLIQALIVFMSLFLSNFTIPVFARPLLPKKVRESMEGAFGKVAVTALLCTMAIFEVLPMTMPPLEPVFFFMPLWTIYLVTRLPKFLGAPKEGSSMTSTVISVLVIGMPFLWRIILEWMLGTSTNAMT